MKNQACVKIMLQASVVNPLVCTNQGFQYPRSFFAACKCDLISRWYNLEVWNKLPGIPLSLSAPTQLSWNLISTAAGE